MSRQSKELQTRWELEGAEYALETLLRGHPSSPYGTHDGRVDLRGLAVERPERVRINDDLARIAKIFKFEKKVIRSVDLSYATLPEWRIHGSAFEDCMFDAAKLVSFRTYSAAFKMCSFRNADLREASLGAPVKEGAQGGVYSLCDFSGADLRNISTEDGTFSQCLFVGSRWHGTQTLTTVFEKCDFRDAEISEVFFDGRGFGKRGPSGLGKNKLEGCDFSTAKLYGTSFLAIDFRNVIPPVADRYVLVRDFPRRVEIATDRLAANGTRDAQWLALRFKSEFVAARALPADAVGMLDFGDLSTDDARLLAAVFELSR